MGVQMRSISTIGYEGATPERFDSALAVARVDVLVDVRADAASGRRGFSKFELSARMKAASRGYLHLRALGAPKPARLAARARDFAAARRLYAAHLETPEAQAAMQELARLSAGRRVALVCFEAEAEECHRSIIAERIATAGGMAILDLVAAEAHEPFGSARTAHRLGLAA